MEDNHPLCPECNAPLSIANSKFESPEGSTDVFSVLKMVCTNGAVDLKTKKTCANFCGKDLNNPLKVVTEIRNKVN